MSYRKYPLNEYFFHTETPEMAYVLGLWWADGSIYKINGKLREFNITLKDNYNLLESIKYHMGTNIPLRKHKRSNSDILKLTSFTICNRLIELNGNTSKSLCLEWPRLNSKFNLDFIRGYFDGDGSIYRKKITIKSSITCGTKSFLEKIQEVLSEYNIVGVIRKQSDTVYILRFNQKETHKLGKILYQNNPSLYMKRKRDLFNELFNKNGQVYKEIGQTNSYENIYNFLNYASNSLWFTKDIENYFNIHRGVIRQILKEESWHFVSNQFNLDIIKQNFIKEFPTKHLKMEKIKNENLSDEEICIKYQISYTTLKSIKP